MTSDRQIAANRRNALRSTGARTPEGRAVSSQNAVRHGVLCERVMVEGENEQRYYDMLESLWAELSPVGERESLLVERLANLFWRERRLIESERGALQRRIELASDPLSGGPRFLSLGEQLIIGRYQTMLTNQISSTLNLIERLQADRQQELGFD